MGVLIGLTMSCIGVFYNPISIALEIGMADVALYSTFLTIARMVGLPIIGKIMPKVDIRASLVVIAILMCAGFASLYFINAKWQLYLVGCVIGLGSGGALYMTAPVLLSAWFKDRLGFAMGVSGASAGIGAALFNPVASNLVGVVGWRLSAVIMAAVAFVIIVPMVLLVFRSKPADKGLLPFGVSEMSSGEAGTKSGAAPAAPAATGITAKQAWTTAAFYMIMLVVLAVGFVGSFQTHMAKFAITVGVEQAQSGFIVSVAGIGAIIAGPLLGVLNDKIGATKTTLIFCVVAIIGAAVGIVTGSSIVLAYMSCFLLGAFTALTTVQLPLLVKSVFGTKEYSQILSRVMSVNSLVVAVSVFLIGLLFDISGDPKTYFGAFVIIIVLCAISAFIVFPLGKASKKLNV
jgi:MFS family permease